MGIFNWLHKPEPAPDAPKQAPDEPKRGAPDEPARCVADGALRERVIAALRTVYDPEIPVNIYDLGLIYGLAIDADGKVRIEMTLTAPGCPVAQTFPATVEDAVLAVAGVSDAKVELVWEPPWSQQRMSEAARLELGML